jgi:anaerobic magnesium-protoporphyrin IX monomethyl ester cyclase
MKLLLVRSNPADVKNTRLPSSLAHEVGIVMPLGIASIAAYIREKGFSVGIIDAQAQKLSLEQLRKKIKEFKPEIVGITSMTPTVHDDLAVARLAKEEGCYTVLGGPQINAMPRETLKNEFVDFGILGEGEYPMYRLIQAIEGKINYNEVPGLIFKNAGNDIVAGEPYIHPDIDLIPFPARDLIPINKYFSLISNGRLTTICPGRGCPFHCGFCFKQPTDKNVRFRNPVTVVDEIEEVIGKYSINEIDFVSDTLTLKKEFIEGLCNEILERNIKISWIAPTRVDCVDPAMLRLMKRSGCRSLRFGVESGSAKILESMNKSTNLEQIIRAFQWAKEAKIETFAYLIIGYLNETEETVKQTLRFVKELKPDLLMYNVATPLPCTALFSQAVQAGIVESDYWQKYLQDQYYPRIPYLFQHTDKWISRAYNEFYLSPGNIIKKIIKIRPNNYHNYLKSAKGLIGLKK